MNWNLFLKLAMKIKKPLRFVLIITFVVSCSDQKTPVQLTQQPVPQPTDNSQPQPPKPVTPPQESTPNTPQTPQHSILDSMAGGAAAGAAAGTAGALTHHLTNRALDNWEKRKRAKRIFRNRK